MLWHKFTKKFHEAIFSWSSATDSLLDWEMLQYLCYETFQISLFVDVLVNDVNLRYETILIQHHLKSWQWNKLIRISSCLMSTLDINECRDRSLCRYGACENTDGSFRCVCPSGYKLSLDQRSCEGKSWYYHCTCIHTLWSDFHFKSWWFVGFVHCLVY